MMMSSGTVICYLPITAAVFDVGFLRNGALQTNVRVFVTEFMLLDTIITPALLLYFMPKLRHAVAARWWCFSRLKAGNFVLDTDSDLEISNSF
ncbi:hypothetical protein HK100_012295 [Physocladia obscura]|uniref:Uncharacterized protein n=1 Tax=Physocladia obscura TaxID=109957 RepID=A0AAD5T0J9_9FUNG|nr:hypothetical protein HK100_012295 [Physocladia obscura]